MRKLSTLFTVFLLSALASFQSLAQSGYKIEGEVVDNFGPVSGAGVLEKGTSNGTATDLDGKFSLTVSSQDALIEISFVGYATQTFAAGKLPKTIKLA